MAFGVSFKEQRVIVVFTKMAHVVSVKGQGVKLSAVVLFGHMRILSM